MRKKQEATVGFETYRDDPAGFARQVLGSTWWKAQEEIARLLAESRRVAVKAANGVGKTYLAADLVLWFLYCHRPSIVLTTAPTWRQVESLLWEEIRKRHRTVNARAEMDPSLPALEGSLLQTRLKIAEGHFALGLSTDEPVRFQGFHAEDLLVVLDEACGVPEEIWDAVEGVCVGANNRVLAISNPLAPVGRFYTLFASPRWQTYTISAMDHPNVGKREEGKGKSENTQGAPMSIPGAVTREAVADRIVEWCEPVSEEEEQGTDEKYSSLFPLPSSLVLWEDRRYRPNALFRSRVLGEFPESAEDSLFALAWIERAMGVGCWVSGIGENASTSTSTPGQRANAVQEEKARAGLDATPDTRHSTPCIVAVDVARFGSDETVFAVRRGEQVTRLLAVRGLDTMEVAGRTLALAREEGAEIVTVDEVGVGAGVVDRLEEIGLPGLAPVHFGARPTSARDADRFLNLRAQTYWALRERLRVGRIALPPDPILAAQLTGLRYQFTSDGKIQIESKDEIRRRGLPSPDRADALALLFCPLAEPIFFIACPLTDLGQQFGGERVEPVRWLDVDVW